MRISYIILLSIFLFTACKREKCPFPGTTVEGIVIDDSTNKPIAGATIFLQRKKCKYDFMSSVCDYIDVKDVESDIDGNFKLKFCKSKKRDYALSATKDGYWPYNYRSRITLDEYLNSDKIIRLKQK